MNLRKILFGGVLCGCAFLASCSPNAEDEGEAATPVAASDTMPPWLVGTAEEGGYTSVSSGSSPTYRSGRVSSTAPRVTASGSGKPSSVKATASRSGKKSSASKAKKSAPKASYYTVKKGDSIDRIARRYKCSNNALMKANELKSDLIHPGKKLRIP